MTNLRKPRQAFHSIDDVARLLNVSTRTVHRLIKLGALTRRKIGSLVRITDEDLEQYIAASRK